MEVKAAVGRAKQWLAEVMNDEQIFNIGLEEVQFDSDQQIWRITLGFSRPWNTVRNAMTAISGESAARRAYRLISVKEPDGDIISMTRRSEIDD